MKCDFMRLVTLIFEMRLKKCIRMGITIFKILIWGGILFDIRSEITFGNQTKFPTATKLNKIERKIRKLQVVV